jgi:hypothetical protein
VVDAEYYLYVHVPVCWKTGVLMTDDHP